jgi:hypothetical protein
VQCLRCLFLCCCSRLGSCTPLSSRVSVCFRLSRDPLRTSWRSCDVCGRVLCPCAFFVVCQTTEWRPLVLRHLESRLRGSGSEGDSDAVDSSSHRIAHMVSALPALCVLGGYVERLRAGGAARLSHVSRACSWWRVVACLGFQYRQRVNLLRRWYRLGFHVCFGNAGGHTVAPRILRGGGVLQHLSHAANYVACRQ